MKININTNVSETQFAKFANAARANGMGVSAYLRKLIAENGIDAELTQTEDTIKDEPI